MTVALLMRVWIIWLTEQCRSVGRGLTVDAQELGKVLENAGGLETELLAHAPDVGNRERVAGVPRSPR